MSGVNNIIEIIKKKTEKEVSKIIAEAEEYRNQRLNKAKERAKTITEEIAGKAKREAESEVSKYEASAKLNAKYKILESKEALMREVLDAAWEKIQGTVVDSSYDKTLTNLAIDGGAALQEEAIELVLPEGQKVSLDTAAIGRSITDASGVKTKVSLSKDRIRAAGGLIIRAADGTKWVDNTFEARRDRLENQIRDKVASALFGEQN